MEPSLDPSQPAPTTAPRTLLQCLKTNEPLLKVLDILLAVLIFGSIITFTLTVLLQGQLSSLWVIPGAIIVGLIVGLFISPRGDQGTSGASFWRRQLFAFALLATGVVLGVVAAIQSVGASNLDTEDIGELIQFLAVLVAISFFVVLTLFVTHWRTRQPSSLLYKAGVATRQAGNIVAGVIIACIAFAGYFFTNLTLDPPDE